MVVQIRVAFLRRKAHVDQVRCRILRSGACRWICRERPDQDGHLSYRSERAGHGEWHGSVEGGRVSRDRRWGHGDVPVRQGFEGSRGHLSYRSERAGHGEWHGSVEGGRVSRDRRWGQGDVPDRQGFEGSRGQGGDDREEVRAEYGAVPGAAGQEDRRQGDLFWREQDKSSVQLSSGMARESDGSGSRASSYRLKNAGIRTIIADY